MSVVPTQQFFKDQIGKLTCLLYPRARAFKITVGSNFDKFHKAIGDVQSSLMRDSFRVLDALIPDNANFSADDATFWERVLGLAIDPSISLADRKMAIRRKMAHPLDQICRQNYRFIQKQLQDAGFNVYVHENWFDLGGGTFGTKTPEEIIGPLPTTAYHSTTLYHGVTTHGAVFNHKIANSLDRDVDASFVIGSNYVSTFYVTGGDIDDFANIPADREKEFRQLILLLKPLQAVGFLFVNYT